MKTLRKFLAGAALTAGCAAILTGWDMMESGAIAAMSLLLWPWDLTQGSNTDNIQNLANKPHNEALAKARADYAMIQGSVALLQDKAMAAQVKHLQAISGKMLQYLDNHPQRIPSAMRFIDYYQDRTAALMRQYVSLRETGLETQEIENLQRDMRTTFQGFTVAYEKQFAKVIDSEILNMGAKLKVAKQLMQDDGIDCDELKTPPMLLEDNETVKESKKETGWTLKQAGIAVGAVALGAVGLWKIFGGDNSKTN